MILNGKKQYLALVKGSGFNFKGEYNENDIYLVTSSAIDCFTFEGATYYTKKDAPAGTSPTDENYFGIMAKAGRGIKTIMLQKTEGLVNTYAIIYDDYNATTIEVANGAKGDKGDTGEKGEKGEKGDKGETGYDLIISTQAEFEEWYATLDAGTCTAKSVLLVGDGGTLKFTRDGAGLKLPNTLYRLDGTNRAVINITNFVYGAADGGLGAIWYASLPALRHYSINNIELICDTTGSTLNGFYNCRQIKGCYAYCSAPNFGASAYGFYSCEQLENCKGITSSYSGSIVFNKCKQLTNCEGSSTSSSSSTYAFSQCEQITNCKGEANAKANNRYGVGFATCIQLTNCTGIGKNANSSSSTSGANGYGFSNCIQLTNCKGTGTAGLGTGTGVGYGFNNCSYLSNCKAGDTASTTSLLGGSNTYVDSETVA